MTNKLKYLFSKQKDRNNNAEPYVQKSQDNLICNTNCKASEEHIPDKASDHTWSAVDSTIFDYDQFEGDIDLSDIEYEFNDSDIEEKPTTSRSSSFSRLRSCNLKPKVKKLATRHVTPSFTEFHNVNLANELANGRCNGSITNLCKSRSPSFSSVMRSRNTLGYITSQTMKSQESHEATRQITSKIGSLDNSAHKPGGGNVSIFQEKLNFVSVSSKCGSKDNISHQPDIRKKYGGKVQILNQKLQFREQAVAKVGSLENSDHKPGGNNFKIFHERPKWKAGAKINSLEQSDYRPSGGNRKIVSYPVTFRENAQPKVDSFENFDWEPDDPQVEIFNDRLPWLKYNKPNLPPEEKLRIEKKIVSHQKQKAHYPDYSKNYVFHGGERDKFHHHQEQYSERRSKSLDQVKPNQQANNNAKYSPVRQQKVKPKRRNIQREDLFLSRTPEPKENKVLERKVYDKKRGYQPQSTKTPIVEEHVPRKIDPYIKKERKEEYSHQYDTTKMSEETRADEKPKEQISKDAIPPVNQKLGQKSKKLESNSKVNRVKTNQKASTKSPEQRAKLEQNVDEYREAVLSDRFVDENKSFHNASEHSISKKSALTTSEKSSKRGDHKTTPVEKEKSKSSHTLSQNLPASNQKKQGEESKQKLSVRDQGENQKRKLSVREQLNQLNQDKRVDRKYKPPQEKPQKADIPSLKRKIEVSSDPGSPEKSVATRDETGRLHDISTLNSYNNRYNMFPEKSRQNVSKEKRIVEKPKISSQESVSSDGFYGYDPERPPLRIDYDKYSKEDIIFRSNQLYIHKLPRVAYPDFDKSNRKLNVSPGRKMQVVTSDQLEILLPTATVDKLLSLPHKPAKLYSVYNMKGEKNSYSEPTYVQKQTKLLNTDDRNRLYKYSLIKSEDFINDTWVEQYKDMPIMEDKQIESADEIIESKPLPLDFNNNSATPDHLQNSGKGSLPDLRDIDAPLDPISDNPNINGLYDQPSTVSDSIDIEESTHARRNFLKWKPGEIPFSKRSVAKVTSRSYSQQPSHRQQKASNATFSQAFEQKKHWYDDYNKKMQIKNASVERISERDLNSIYYELY